ncbi:hypothetical protein PMIN04_004223 [Paraphaeosphaeria minitans]
MCVAHISTTQPCDCEEFPFPVSISQTSYCGYSAKLYWCRLSSRCKRSGSQPKMQFIIQLSFVQFLPLLHILTALARLPTVKLVFSGNYFVTNSTMWHSHDTVAVVELIFYIPTIFLAIYACYKHGFKRSSGWLYTLILCLIRIIGSVCQFVSNNNLSTGLLQTIFILDSVGLSPLLLATLGVLSRFVDFVNSKTTPVFTVRHFRIVQLVLTLGIVLSIVGGTSITPSANGSYTSPTSSKVGVVLYIVGFVAILFILLVSVPRRAVVPARERHVPIVISLALPLIAVRLLYSILSVFVHDHLFSITTGSVAVNIGMSVIE